MVKGGYRRKSETEWNFQLTNNDLHNICKTEEINALYYANKRNISHTWQDNLTGHYQRDCSSTTISPVSQDHKQHLKIWYLKQKILHQTISTKKL